MAYNVADNSDPRKQKLGVAIEKVIKAAESDTIRFDTSISKGYIDNFYISKHH